MFTTCCSHSIVAKWTSKMKKGDNKLYWHIFLFAIKWNYILNLTDNIIEKVSAAKATMTQRQFETEKSHNPHQTFRIEQYYYAIEYNKYTRYRQQFVTLEWLPNEFRLKGSTMDHLGNICTNNIHRTHKYIFSTIFENNARENYAETVIFMFQ